MDEKQLNTWCIVELFGHTKIAGLVSEQTIGGGSFVRVDVPETKKHDAYTKFYGNGAIYAITPVTEELARGAAEYYCAAPFTPYELRDIMQPTPPCIEYDDDATPFDDCEEDSLF